MIASSHLNRTLKNDLLRVAAGHLLRKTVETEGLHTADKPPTPEQYSPPRNIAMFGVVDLNLHLGLRAVPFIINAGRPVVEKHVSSREQALSQTPERDGRRNVIQSDNIIITGLI
jgi:hypothetical protein